MQSHASTSVRTLNIPNTGSHTIVWTQENTVTGMGSAALVAAVPYPGKVIQISHKGHKSTHTHQKTTKNNKVTFHAIYWQRTRNQRQDLERPNTPSHTIIIISDIYDLVPKGAQIGGWVFDCQ